MTSAAALTSFRLDFEQRVFTCGLIIISVLNKQTVNLRFMRLKHDTFALSARLPARLRTGSIQNQATTNGQQAAYLSLDTEKRFVTAKGHKSNWYTLDYEAQECVARQ